METAIIFLTGSIFGIALILAAGLYILKTGKGAIPAQASTDAQPATTLKTGLDSNMERSSGEPDHSDMLFCDQTPQKSSISDSFMETPDLVWHCLPGNVLELGTTGFQIRLVPDLSRPHHPYRLISPEGAGLMYGAEGALDLVKDCAKKMASDRLSFNNTNKNS